MVELVDLFGMIRFSGLLLRRCRVAQGEREMELGTE